MAKYNDMPELNSAKVFLTNLFTKAHRQIQHHYYFKHRQQKTKTLYLTTFSSFTSVTKLSGNSDMNDFTINGFICINTWLKDKLTVFTKNIYRLPA